MAQGLVQETLAEVKLPGVIAKRMRRHYNPGTRVSACLPDHMLLWRITPVKIGVKTAYQRSAAVCLGQLMLVPAKTTTEVIAPEYEEDVDSISLEMQPSWLNKTVEAGEGWLTRDPDFLFNFRNKDIEVALRRIAAEMSQPGPCTKLLIEACSLAVAANLFRSITNRASKADYQGSDYDTHRIKYVKDIVLDHPQCLPDISQIAESLAITPAHLGSIFKNKTGKTLYAYIQEIRIERAKSLLRDVKLPLKRVAHQLGYCSPSAFSSAFRLATGATPREYRFMHFS